jgi:WD40 repeat protein
MSDVFISYSRRDIELVSRLCDGLRNRGKTVFVDVGEYLGKLATPPLAMATVAEKPATATPETEPHVADLPVVDPASVAATGDGAAAGPSVAAATGDGAVADDLAAERARAEISGIPPSAPWMEEIKAAIAAADSVIVVISPDSCASAVCGTELDYAIGLNKRLVPVIARETPAELVPPALASLNWLPVNPGQSFDSDVDRLVEVLDTDVEGLHLHTRLTLRSQEWSAGGHDRSLLLRGKELETAEQWLAAQSARKPAPTSEQTSYILASRAAATRRQRGSVAIGLTLALVMTALTVFAGFQWRAAVVQRRTADAQRDVAVSRALAAESSNSLEADPQLGLLLALRAYRSAPTTQAESAVRAAVGANAVRGYLPAPPSERNNELLCPSNTSGPGAFDNSGQYAVVTCAGYVEVWRWAGRQGPGSVASPYLVHPGGSPSRAIFNWAGNAVLFVGRDGWVYQWDWQTSSHVQAVTGPLLDPMLFPTAAGTLVASENGQSIAITNLSTGLSSAIRVPCCHFGDTTISPPIVFSPNGAEIATLTYGTSSVSAAGTVSVFDASTGARIFSKTVAGAQLPLALSSQGRIAVAAGASAEVFSVTNPAQPPAMHQMVSPPGQPAHCCDVDSPLAMTWTPNGQALAVGTEDPWMRVYLGVSSSPIYLDDSAATGGGGVAFSPDGQYLLTSGFGASQVWQWAATTSISLTAPSLVDGTAVSPDGQTFAVAEANNTILLWNWRTSQLRTLYIKDSHVKSGTQSFVYLAFSPNGKFLVSAGPDDDIRAWSMSTFTQDGASGVLPGAPVSIAFSPGGSYLGVAYVGGVAWWRTSGTSKPLRIVQRHNDGGLILSLSNAGAMQMLMFPPLNPNVPLIGELINVPVGSDTPTRVAPVALPGAPGTTGTMLPGHRLLICNQTCYLYLVGDDFVRRLKAPALLYDSGWSLTTNRRILYLTTQGGVVTAWDLNNADPPVSVTTTSGAVPGVQAGANSDYILLTYNSTLELVPTAQHGAFPSVLGIARSEVVRPFTAAERKQYLAGTQAG